MSFLLGGALLAALLCAPTLRAQEEERAPTGVVGFRAAITPDTVYVGQQATYELIVTIPPDVRQRLRRNPQFVAPEARSMLAYDLPAAKPGVPGEGTEVHIFRRALFPLTPGRYSIPPARLTYTMPQSPSFFSREEERSLTSRGLVFVAIEPPAEGRPAGWGGAVGRWRVRARTDAATVRQGDPFVLTLRVEGSGNATLLTRPELTIDWANVVAADERVVLDSTPTTLAGAKEFAWLVTPRETGARDVPPLEFIYFEPSSRSYETARTASLRVRVLPGDLVSMPTRAAAAAAAAVPLTIRPQLIGATRVTLPWLPAWGWIALLAPLPWFLARWRDRRPHVPRVRAPVERLADKAITAPGAIRSLFDEAITARTGIAIALATGAGVLSAALRREGVTDETAAEAERLRDALDAGAYAKGGRGAGATGGVAALRERTRNVVQRIEREARRRAGAVLLLVAMLAQGCAPVAVHDDVTLVAFTEGQTAYAGKDFSRARDAFLRAANATPRDAAAWANLGTAGWQAGDTATAVLGWQRALRLDPVDGELRGRLARVRAPQSRGAAQVWPIPRLSLALAAFVLWCLGWAWAAWRRRHKVQARFAAVLLVPALLLAALASVGEWQSRARDLVVIASPSPLRALPALGAEQGSLPLVGEVVRIRERRGVWVRIELDAGRAGWFPLERTYPLARN